MKIGLNYRTQLTLRDWTSTNKYVFVYVYSYAK